MLRMFAVAALAMGMVSCDRKCTRQAHDASTAGNTETQRGAVKSAGRHRSRRQQVGARIADCRNFLRNWAVCKPF